MATSNTEDILKKANHFLAYLNSHCHALQTALGVIYPNLDDFNKHYNNATQLSQKLWETNTKGALIGTYEAIYAQYDPDELPGTVQQVIDLLKTTNRISQIGPGKGKLLVIFNSTSVTGSEYIEKTITTNDALGLSKALKDAVTTLCNDNKVLREQVEGLKKAVNEKEVKIRQLTSEINIKYKTSWT